MTTADKRSGATQAASIAAVLASPHGLPGHLLPELVRVALECEVNDLKQQLDGWLKVIREERAERDQQVAQAAFARACGARDALRWALGLTSRRPGPSARTEFSAAGVRFADESDLIAVLNQLLDPAAVPPAGCKVDGVLEQVSRLTGSLVQTIPEARAAVADYRSRHHVE